VPAFNCTDRSSEFSDAAACCGAAVLDHAGRPVGAISAAGPAERMEPIFARIAPIVASTAEAISRRLGYAPR
jgi:DNA-binding IclR family transcriptional regulator